VGEGRAKRTAIGLRGGDVLVEDSSLLAAERIEILIGREWVYLFWHDQSGVDAALCRANSKTPSFFRRDA
jgi:hypothetical protein